MRPFIGLGVLATLALSSTPSPGDTSNTEVQASTPPIVFHALPTGHVSSAPGEKPRPGAVGAGSKAEGLWTHRVQGNGVTAVFASLAAAQESGFMLTRASPAASETAVQEHACVTAETFGREEALGEPWHPGDREANVSDPSSGEPRVHAMHSESLTATPDGKATLTWTDAWVDALSAGAKLIAKGSVPLVKIATGPQGLMVYGAREDGWVHFVVRSPDPPTDGPMKDMVRAMGSQIEARWPGDMRQSNSNCGFMRVSLPVGPTAKATATFATEMVLPPLRDTSKDAADPLAAMRAMRSIRRRALEIYVSSSQSSSDPEPVVSVAFGWAGADTNP